MSVRPTPAPPLPDGKTNQNPPGLRFREIVAEDFRHHGSRWMSQGFWALFVNRFGNARMDVHSRLLRIPLTAVYLLGQKGCEVFCGIKLDYTVKVGRRVRLDHFGGMVLGAREIGDDVIVRQNTTFGVRTTRDLNAKPIIGSRVDIGAGAVIVGHIRIGDDCVIGANCVVAQDVPPNSRVMPPKVTVQPRKAAGMVSPDDGPTEPQSLQELDL